MVDPGGASVSSFDPGPDHAYATPDPTADVSFPPFPRWPARAPSTASTASPAAGAAPGSAPPRRASAMPPVKVRDVKVYRLKQATFVEVVSDAGISGWGECAGDNNHLMQAFIDNGLKQEVVGQDVFDAERMWDWMFFENHDLGPGGALPNAIAGIDIALWDLKGRLLGLPVYKLIGGKYRDKIQIYGSYGVQPRPGRRSTTPSRSP